MSSFKMAFHKITGRRVIEVFEGSEFIAAIYPDDGARGFKIVSKHGFTAELDEGAPPAMIVTIGKSA